MITCHPEAGTFAFFALSAIAYSTYSNVEEAEAALVSPAVGE